MQERAMLLGGELAVESHPDQGTTVRAKLPLRRGQATGRPPLRVAGPNPDPSLSGR
jgi:signal transduction histidine kinase